MPLPIYTSAAFTNGSGVSVASNASVEVRRESDGSLVPIFEDRDGENQITQPGFQADLEGRFEFYAEPAAEGWEITVTAGSDEHTLNSQFPQGGVFGIPEGERAINSHELLAAVSEAADVDEAVSFIGRGAIVESGTNANGSFVRWENGDQVCFVGALAMGSITAFGDGSRSSPYRSSSSNWDYPAVFVGVPVLSGIPFVNPRTASPVRESLITRVANKTDSFANVQVQRMTEASNSDSVEASLTAWGFWK